MLAQAGLQLRHAGLERGDLLVEQEVVGLDLGEQASHEGTHSWGSRGPIER